MTQNQTGQASIDVHHESSQRKIVFCCVFFFFFLCFGARHKLRTRGYRRKPLAALHAGRRHDAAVPALLAIYSQQNLSPNSRKKERKKEEEEEQQQQQQQQQQEENRSHPWQLKLGFNSSDSLSPGPPPPPPPLPPLHSPTLTVGQTLGLQLSFGTVSVISTTVAGFWKM